MEQIELKVYYDPAGNTLTVWYGNPADEDITSETGEEVNLMKDKNGRVIGVEILNVGQRPGLPIKLQFESFAEPEAYP